ncbi:SDR family NAD(P)-dependent oxidoreductase [Sporolactobacillus spathodeae]|uniref:Short-subunit dehydrogenase n=1 Tax=Sporolactobacillus spathodeae TaxID=1465502 RepID=A0ABS2Q870_9BACL|nr:SDR family oxidoreductase [Sporolactobacillus spathodeae]MBM7657982.1 short-subunit dehydrogenase [Sporolactobacillus spathodeae]
MTQTALITGASSGIGYEMVQLLAAEGYNLILVARNHVKLQEIKASLPNQQVVVIAQDLSLPGASKLVYDKVAELGLTVDVLINNAGFGRVGAFHALTLQEQMQMIQLNIAALTELTYLFLPDIKKRQGMLLNVASTAAFQPGPFMAVYFASKAFVLSLTEALAEELAGTGVHVTALCPGPTHTNFGKVAHAENIKMFARTMDAAVVAKKGWTALKSGKQVMITGAWNRVGAFAAKLLPSIVAVKAVRTVTRVKKEQ